MQTEIIERNLVAPLDESDYFWQQINLDDYRYLTGQRNWPTERCTWCGGYLIHSRGCESMQSTWTIKITFGKYKGKTLAETPVEYLEWLAANRVGGDRFQSELKQWLENNRQETPVNNKKHHVPSIDDKRYIEE